MGKVHLPRKPDCERPETIAGQNTKSANKQQAGFQQIKKNETQSKKTAFTKWYGLEVFLVLRRYMKVLFANLWKRVNTIINTFFKKHSISNHIGG